VEGRRLDRSPVDVTVVMKLMLSRDLARANPGPGSIRCASAEACGLRAGAGELFRSRRTSYTVSFAKGPIEKVGRPELVQAPACPHSPSTPAIASPVVGPVVAVAVHRPRDEHGAWRHDDGWASHRGRDGHENASSNTHRDRSNDEQRSGQTAESVASHVNPPIRLDAIGSDGISWGTVVRASSPALPPRRSGPLTIEMQLSVPHEQAENSTR